MSTHTQRAFAFDTFLRREERESQLYDLFRKAVKAMGGLDALRACLDEKESYITSISKAMNRVDDGNGQRKVPIEWLGALDEDAAFEFAVGFCDLWKFDPPVRQPEVEQPEVEAGAWEVIDEIPDPELREMMMRRLARKLGVRRERLKR